MNSVMTAPPLAPVHTWAVVAPLKRTLSFARATFLAAPTADNPRRVIRRLVEAFGLEWGVVMKFGEALRAEAEEVASEFEDAVILSVQSKYWPGHDDVVAAFHNQVTAKHLTPIPDDLVSVPPLPCDFKVGDAVIFTNDYGVEFKRRVRGFASDPEAHRTGVDPESELRFIYVFTDAWWFPTEPSSLRHAVPAQ